MWTHLRPLGEKMLNSHMRGFATDFANLRIIFDSSEENAEIEDSTEADKGHRLGSRQRESGTNQQLTHESAFLRSR
jgi:hypothetical protein